MEIVKLEISKDILQTLVDSDAISTNDFKLIAVNEKDFDYTGNPIWLKAKEDSDKAYKLLKKIEWEIRNK